MHSRLALYVWLTLCDVFRILIRTDEEELEDETATALEQQTSLFGDLLSGHLDGPEQEAGQGNGEDLASAVVRQLSVCLELVYLTSGFVCSRS